MILAEVSNKLAANGSGIAAVGDFQHQSSIDVLPFV